MLNDTYTSLTKKKIKVAVFIIWASLVAQMVKNPPAMWETWVHPWVGKIPWRREQLPTPVFWPGEFHGLYSTRGLKSQTWLSDLHFQGSY